MNIDYTIVSTVISTIGQWEQNLKNNKISRFELFNKINKAIDFMFVTGRFHEKEIKDLEFYWLKYWKVSYFESLITNNHGCRILSRCSHLIDEIDIEYYQFDLFFRSSLLAHKLAFKVNSWKRDFVSAEFIEKPILKLLEFGTHGGIQDNPERGLDLDFKLIGLFEDSIIDTETLKNSALEGKIMQMNESLIAVEKFFQTFFAQYWLADEAYYSKDLMRNILSKF